MVSSAGQSVASMGIACLVQVAFIGVAKKAPTCDRYIKSVSEIEAITQMQGLREITHQYP